MKLKIFCDSRAGNLKSHNVRVVDVEEDLGIPLDVWATMSEDARYLAIKDYWESHGVPEIYYEEIE